MITRTRFATLACVLFALSACAQLGLAPAQTLDQKLTYAYSGVDAALKTIVLATADGTLSSSKATSANQMALAVKSTLDVARATESTNATSAANDLALATSALSAVQQYLSSNGAK
jgi:hypothetical protein